MSTYFPVSDTGFTVYSVYKNTEREKVVYWALDLPEAIQYAQMINEFFPETCSAYVATAHGAKVWGEK